MLRAAQCKVPNQTALGNGQYGFVNREAKGYINSINGGVGQKASVANQLPFYAFVGIYKTAVPSIDVLGFYATVFFVVFFKNAQPVLVNLGIFIVGRTKKK